MQESQETSRYCDKFIVMISIAAILQASIKSLTLQNQEYLPFYVIATSTLLVATLLFIIGWRYYIHMKPYDSVLINCISVYKNVFQTWRESNRRNTMQVMNF